VISKDKLMENDFGVADAGKWQPGTERSEVAGSNAVDGIKAG
jgi:hypothetical protein